MHSGDGGIADARRPASSGDLMTHHFEEAIRHRAYELWERAGRNGSAEEHWLRAEREIMGSPSSLTHPIPLGSVPKAIPSPPQIGSEPAAQLADRLRPFYESLPQEPAPEEHWDAVIQLAIGPDEEFRKQLTALADAPPVDDSSS
jgi:hypothetical protein